MERNKIPYTRSMVEEALGAIVGDTYENIGMSVPKQLTYAATEIFVNGSWGITGGKYTQTHIDTVFSALVDLRGVGRFHYETEPQKPSYTPCGGCGETDPRKRCIGCMHRF